MASTSCVACESNSYKPQPGNDETCTACPSGFVTFATGSVFASSCYSLPSPAPPPDVPAHSNSSGDANESGNGSSENGSDNITFPGDEPIVQPAEPAVSNESSVPAVTFSISLSNFPVQEGNGDLAEQLKVTEKALRRTEAESKREIHTHYTYICIYNYIFI